jgi:hypothetical protein
LRWPSSDVRILKRRGNGAIWRPRCQRVQSRWPFALLLALVAVSLGARRGALVIHALLTGVPYALVVSGVAARSGVG